ncbi:DUF5594 family protein [Burkholderia ambifaria]|nr:DUF5594 family protein [Burkholderia ambifaria]
MNDGQWARFEDDFAIRIAERIGRLYHPSVVSVDVVLHGDGLPARVRIVSKSQAGETGFPHLLNLYLVWREGAIEKPMAETNPSYFEAYLDSIPIEMQQWMKDRPVDFGSRTQRELMEVLKLDHFDA